MNRPAVHTDARGFTLLEVVLSVSILALLAGVSMPILMSFQSRNDLDVTTGNLVGMLRRAETYARAVNGDSQWGVEIQSSGATLFKGSSFAGRDASYDETAAVSNGVAASGLTEVLFDKVSGLPNTTGSITLMLNSNEIRTITINAKGMVTY